MQKDVEAAGPVQVPSLSSDKFEVTSMGVNFNGKMTYKDFEHGLEAAFKWVQAGKWAQIDLLTRAHESLGDSFYQLVDNFHYAPGTVVNMLWIGRNFHYSQRGLRVEGVSISHHQVVAPPRFTPEEKRTWLETAKDMRWSRQELREATSGLLKSGEEEEPVFPIPITASSAIRMVIDWVDGKVEYTPVELKEVLVKFLKDWEREREDDD